MKWQTAAEKVLQALTESRWLGRREAGGVQELVAARKAVEAFRAAYSILTRRGWRVGWNKFWQGSDLLSWYGDLALCQPLRHVAHEIENIALQGEEARKRLTALRHGWLSSIPATRSRIPLNLVFDVDEHTTAYNLSAKSCPDFRRIQTPLLYDTSAADNAQQTEALLECYGFAPSSLRQTRDYLRLLQRLNLDLRERPIVERWRWTKGCGMAYLSDEGRFQIKPALAWARGIEETLLRWGEMSKLMTAFLGGVDAEALESPLPKEPLDPGLETLLKGLQSVDFIQCRCDRVRFTAPPGGFPTLALQLWA